MLEIRKDNVHRLVSEADYGNYWKGVGFEIVYSEVGSEESAESGEAQVSTGHSLDALKAEADALGVKYHHNAGADKIRQAIDALKAENSAFESSD